MIDISIADTQLSEEEIQAAIAVLRSGALRQGKEVTAFEDAFAEWVGAEHAIACSNGSASLHLAYLAMLEPGDEVLVPSFTFIATASMASFAGAVPIFCDVDPTTQLLDLNDAASRITPKTKAIAPVHLFGNACDVDAFTAFAAEHDLAIIWDAAQAHGAHFGANDIGAAPGAVSYSFYPTKNLFVGEGGMVTTPDADLAAKIRLLRSHGVSGKYNHVILGLNYRMTDVEGAIGRTQLTRLDAMLAQRRANAAVLDAALEQVPGVDRQATTPGSTHAVHQYSVTVNEEAAGISRDGLVDHLTANGVGHGIHYPRGLHQQPAYIDLYGTQTLPVTEALSLTILALPVHHGLTEDQMTRVGEVIAEATDG